MISSAMIVLGTVNSMATFMAFVNGTTASYHIFNTETFRDCIRGKQITFLGPSYMRDLFRTAVDLLHGINTEDVTTYPHYTLPTINSTVSGPGFDKIRFFRVNGFAKDWNVTLQALNFSENAIMLADNFHWDVQKILPEHGNLTVSEVSEWYFGKLKVFLDLCKEHNVTLIWMSQMSLFHVAYDSTVPIYYRPMQDRILSYLNETILLLREYNIPFIDVYHMTRNCITDKKVRQRWKDEKVCST